MTKLDQLYDLRARVDAAIAAEVRRLEAEARRERERYEATVLAEQELRRLGSVQRGRKNLTIALCGTETGYTRHRRTLNEAACDACKAAHRLYERQRLARKRESTTVSTTTATVIHAQSPQPVDGGLSLIRNVPANGHQELERKGA